MKKPHLYRQYGRWFACFTGSMVTHGCGHTPQEAVADLLEELECLAGASPLLPTLSGALTPL